MERETPPDNVAASIVAARRWLTLEQLLEVLPLKKSYINYQTHTRQTPVTRIGPQLPFDYNRIVAWLGEGKAKDASDLPRQKGKPTLVR